MQHEIFKNINLVLFDCDGVVYHGDHLLPGVVELLSQMRAAENIIFRFVTNTSARSRECMHKKFASFGLAHLVDVTDCYPSGMAAGEYLRSRCPQVRSVYVAGARGLREELERCGFVCLGGELDDNREMTDAEFLRLSEEDPQIDAVVVGFDSKFNYYKLARSSLCFQKNNKCVFVASNGDIKDKMGPSYFVPGNGAILQAVVAAVNGLPFPIENRVPVVVGKPNPLFGNIVCAGTNVDPKNTLIIGDSLHTDIALGKNCGFRTCLVMTGVTSAEDLENSDVKPEWVINSLSDVLNK